MARKRWTPQTEITDALLKFREKRKWQLGFRRYVVEKMPSESYAPYFGLDIESLRQWFELELKDGLNWDNFGKAWQFDHIIPTSYFDFSKESDLKLCWNFINVRVARLEEGKPSRPVDHLTIQSYFLDLFNKTGYSVCASMIDKIKEIESAETKNNSTLQQFINSRIGVLEKITTLEHEEFNRLNQGSTVEDLLLEREILRKFS